MASSDIKGIKSSEKHKKWLGQEKPSDRIPGLIEMVVEGDDFLISSGAKDLLTGKAASGSFIASGLDVAGTTYTKAQLSKLSKDSAGNWKKSMTPMLAVFRQIRNLPTGDNSQLQIIGPKGMRISIGKIEKTAKLGGQAGGNPIGSKPDTQQNEKVTLEIFKILLGPSDYDGPKGAKGPRITQSMLSKPHIHSAIEKDFDLICMGKLPGHPQFNLSKIWPGLTGVKDSAGNLVPSAKLPNAEGGDVKMREWYYHFLLQFERIELDTKLPDDVFTVFTYDEFLDFIEQLVKVGPPTHAALASKTAITSDLTIEKTNRAPDKTWPKFGIIPKKDSWNPADIWLINQSSPRYKNIILRLKQSQTIAELNSVLIEAFRAKPKIIVGISLKKSDAGSHSPATHVGAKLHYDLVNLTIKGKLPELNPVRFDSLEVNLPWDKSQMEFTTITNILKVNEVKREAVGGKTTFKVIKEAEMRIGSGQSDTHNINLEYKPKKGGGQLGKIPKTLLPTVIGNILGTSYTLPTWKEADAAIPDSKKGKKYTDMKNLVKKVSDCPLFTFKDKDQLIKGTQQTFINDIMEAKSKGKWKKDSRTHKSVTMAVQIMQFYGTLADIYNSVSTHQQRKFNKFIKDTYNLAQKRGEIFGSSFGPFGKLH